MVAKDEAYEKYFSEIRKEYRRGESTELTHRTAIKEFIETINSHLELSGENKQIRGIGRPDFICFKKKIKIGYFETKDLFDISSEQGLNKIITSTQLIKYQNEAIPNLILTDYLRFVLIRNREKRFDITLFTKEDLDKGKFEISEELVKQFNQMIESFLDYSLPTIKNSTDLAYELSKRAVLLRELIKEQLHEDLEKIKNNEDASPIYEFYEAFKELIKDAKPEDCVDAYAQTITYGLFLSKIGSQGGLNRDSAATYIPSSIKIIKKIFANISGDDLPSNCSWIVDEIIDILNAADIEKILSEFVFEGKHYKDPFIHFYEDFLKEYDPEKRKHLGVYYTPEPIVSFITNSINEILKKDFGKSTGFADDSINVLDFATGTGTFLANSFVLALKEIRKAGLAGIEKSKVENHLLKHFYGFEILVSPYVIAHLKLGLLLKQEGHEIHGNERAQVYLTNTLDPQETISSLRGFLKELSHETMMANTIKVEKPVLVVMGNPPYSVSSSNKSEWITNLMKDYKKDLNERNIQPLNDDYIKFLRYAQRKIEENKEGIVGVITNNSYLKGIIHRVMRSVLLNTFDAIYILNLHGNSLIKEETPSGGIDENVFDIRVGVCIVIFIKSKKREDKGAYYYDLYGTRESKYEFLNEHQQSNIEWKKLKPTKPYFFFVESKSQKSKYFDFPSLSSIFELKSAGVKTSNDELLVTFDSTQLQHNITERVFKKELIFDYAYRPFDIRKIYFDTTLIDRPREPLASNLKLDNLSLCISRNTTMKGDFSSVLVSDCFSDLKYCEYSRGCYFFPLYITGKKQSKQKTLKGEIIESKFGRQPNFSEQFLKSLSEKYPTNDISPEEVFGYIYGLLHSKIYRAKYEEFLKTDFPRIQLVKEYAAFKKISSLGTKLIHLHLLKTKVINKANAKFDISGSNEVKSIKYNDGKVFINDRQFFENIPKDVWNFNIGGYQVIDKWLKSRKERKLTHTEIETYIQIVNVLSETIQLMNEIDKTKIE